jgi:hypothetical protein
MRQFKLLGLTLMAVFVAAVAVASTASAALPANLPISATARAWTGTNEGKVELSAGGSKIVCAEAPSSGEEEAGKPLGPFHIEFKNCTTEGGAIKCTGLGDAAGIILTLGTWHLVFDNLTTLSTALLFLIEHVHFSCSALVLILVLGELLCLHLKPTEKALTHSFHCVETSAGKQEDETYFNEAGTAVNNVTLLCSINEAEEKPCFELALGSTTYKVEIFADI